MILSRMKMVCCMVIMLLAHAAVPAAESKVALVIGNSRYVAAPLANSVHDARAISKNLRELGFTVIERENLTQKQIGPMLREFKSRLTPGAVALFYYAGHGLQLKCNNYLPSVDADISSEEDVSLQSLDLNKVLDVMEEAKTRLNLVFLDACRNNPYTRGFRSVGDGLARVNAPSGTLISFATRPGSIASDGSGKNGLYTEHLLTAMMVPGRPIEQVLKQVVKEVKQSSKGKQEPWMEGSIDGEFFFVAAAKISPGVLESVRKAQQSPERPSGNANAAMELAYWDAIKNSTNVADFEGYLSTWPQGKFAILVRAKIKLMAPKLSTINSEPIRLASVAPTSVVFNMKISQSVPKLGDSYTYQKVDPISNTATLLKTEKVTQITDHDVIYNDGELRTDYLGNYSIEPGGFRHFEIFPNIFSREYVIGKTWSLKTETYGMNGGTKIPDGLDINLKVVSKEKITIPAGTFDAFKIEMEGWTRGGARYLATVWVAPNHVKRYLALELNVSETQITPPSRWGGIATGRYERHELVSFNQDE